MRGSSDGGDAARSSLVCIMRKLTAQDGLSMLACGADGVRGLRIYIYRQVASHRQLPLLPRAPTAAAPALLSAYHDSCSSLPAARCPAATHTCAAARMPGMHTALLAIRLRRACTHMHSSPHCHAPVRNKSGTAAASSALPAAAPPAPVKPPNGTETRLVQPTRRHINKVVTRMRTQHARAHIHESSAGRAQQPPTHPSAHSPARAGNDQTHQ